MSGDGLSMLATLPMPMTAHPELADHADAIRSGLAARPYAITYMPTEDRVNWRAPSSSTRVGAAAILTVRKAWAPAPWTDEPYGYAWRVATDGVRWVAGEAYREPIHVPPWERWRP